MSLYDLLIELRNEGDSKPQPDSVKFATVADSADPYVATSAFHKELRRGDFEKAAYWALVLDRVRSRYFVMRYMSNVATEESHCCGLKTSESEQFLKSKHASLVDVLRMVETFCNCKYWRHSFDVEEYVWHLESSIWRVNDEHIASKKRIFEPQPELLAKWEKKLPKTVRELDVQGGLYMQPEWCALLEQAVVEKDFPTAMYWVLLQDAMWKVHKYLKDLLVCNAESEKLHEVLCNKAFVDNSFWGYDYEALLLQRFELEPEQADWYEGEPRTEEQLLQLVADVYAEVAEKGLREAPLYALDQHTRAGKAVWLKQKSQIRPNEPVTVMDLRYAAEWVSVYWRTEARRQHGTILVPWEDVQLDVKRFNKMLWGGAYEVER